MRYIVFCLVLALASPLYAADRVTKMAGRDGQGRQFFEIEQTTVITIVTTEADVDRRLMLMDLVITQKQAERAIAVAGAGGNIDEIDAILLNLDINKAKLQDWKDKIRAIPPPIGGP